MKETKLIICIVISTLFIIVFSSCSKSEKSVEIEKIKPKIGAGFEVFANKETTDVKALFNHSFDPQTFQIKFNNNILSNPKESNGQTEYNAVFDGYQALNSFVITKIDDKKYTFNVEVQPVDFSVEEPFTIHRLAKAEIPLSGKYTETNDLWLSIVDNNIDGYKEIAEFNKNKNAIILPEYVRKRLALGDAKISLHNVKIKGAEEFEQNDLFEGTMHIDYSSEIKLNIVK